MSLKIALCLSGHARTYYFTKQFWDQNVFAEHNVDVFMHVWDTIGPRSFGKNRTETFPEPRSDYDSGIIDSPYVDIDHIKSVWNPVEIVTEDYNSLHEMFCKEITPILHERDRRGIPAGFEHHHPLSVRSMLYKRYKCNELKNAHESNNNIKYDLVIQARPDIAITQAILSEVVLNKDLLYFHNCRSVTPDPEINDFGCMGSSENIDVWCDLYNNIDSLFDVLKNDDNFFKFLNPHKMYVQYLMSQSKMYKEIDLGLSIVRDTGRVLGWPHSQNIIKTRMY
jgi:hypothetical protein